MLWWRRRLSKADKTYFESAGKGDSRRPDSVSQDTFRSNWDAIFKKENKAPELNPDKYCQYCKGTGVIFDCSWSYDCSCKQ